jgi:hypothetical protein
MNKHKYLKYHLLNQAQPLERKKYQKNLPFIILGFKKMMKQQTPASFIASYDS